jgi:hypothetical protein
MHGDGCDVATICLASARLLHVEREGVSPGAVTVWARNWPVYAWRIVKPLPNVPVPVARIARAVVIGFPEPTVLVTHDEPGGVAVNGDVGGGDAHVGIPLRALAAAE